MKLISIFLLLLIACNLSLAYRYGAERRVVKGLIDRIQGALRGGTPMRFEINGNNERLCVGWNAEGECVSVGVLGAGSAFPKLRDHFMELKEIPFCKVYSNFHGCDLCESGRAFNGNECAPCARGSSLRGADARHECEFPWRSVLDKTLYGNRGRGQTHYSVYRNCIKYKNDPRGHWDSCLRQFSGTRQPMPRQLSPGTDSRRGIWYMPPKSRWRDMPFTSRHCSAYSFGKFWCNCKATDTRNGCTQCDDDFLLKGQVTDRRYDMVTDHDTSIYTSYVCVFRKQSSNGCDVLRHNMDQNEDHSCLKCDWRNGYRMNREGVCTMSD